MKFENKVAVVTGTGTAGMGRAICLALSAEGATVIGLDIQQEGNKETFEMLHAQGGEGEAIYCDITDKKLVKETIDQIGAKYGHIDFLINNAGFSKTVSLVKDDYETVTAAYDKCMAIDSNGAFYVAMAVIPYMLKQGEGRIVNTLTHHVKLNEVPFKVGFNVYAAAKTSLWCLNMNLAAELKEHGIAVNAVCPGPVYTPMLKEYYAAKGLPNSFEDIFKAQGKLIRSEDIAEAISNILSWDAKSGPTAQSVVLASREDCTRLSNPVLYSWVDYR